MGLAPHPDADGNCRFDGVPARQDEGFQDQRGLLRNDEPVGCGTVIRCDPDCCGTGAGKTTYARRLADELGGLRFSIDDWMGTLFWQDSPEPVEFKWTMDRIARCEKQIFDMVRQASARGIPSVLDLGFTRREHRDRFRAMGREAGLSVAVHFLDVAAHERWMRVERRNEDRGETFTMTVDRPMFDFMEGMWEPPLEEEWCIAGGRRFGDCA